MTEVGPPHSNQDPFSQRRREEHEGSETKSSYFVLFVSFAVSPNASDFAPFAIKFFYSSTTETSDCTPLRFNSSKNIR
jgi:hypothetical protein